MKRLKTIGFDNTTPVASSVRACLHRTFLINSMSHSTTKYNKDSLSVYVKPFSKYDCTLNSYPTLIHVNFPVHALREQ